MFHILHLEDSAQDQELIKRILSRGEITAELTHVGSFVDFITAFATRSWNAVLADFYLPDSDGMAALKYVRRVDPHLPFIFVSGVLGEETAIDTLKSGATDYVLKSRLQRLAPSVKRALQESDGRHRLFVAEDALLETEQRFEAMADSAPVPLCVIGSDGDAEFFNRPWIQLTGLTLEQLQGRAWMNSIHPDDIARCTEEFESSFNRREPSTTELRLLRSDGQYQRLVLSLSPRFTPSGEFQGMVGSSVDVIGTKRVEERLLHVAKLESLGMMAGGIAHHFNNLMTSVIGHAELIKENLPAGNPNVDLIEKILQAGNSAAQLTRHMLAYSGRGRLSLEQVNLTVMIRRAKSLVDAFIPRSVQLKLELEDELPLINADAGQIQQAVMNLIVNAAEAADRVPGGTIQVRTFYREVKVPQEGSNIAGESLASGPYVVLEVADNGVGMDLHTQARIFDPFFTTKFTGRGLGLALVMGAARSHQAGIQLRSEIGHGSTFTLLFPQACQTSETRETSPPVKQPISAEKVLVVDDEPLILSFIRLSLARGGFEVVTAENGVHALHRLDELRFDLVLLDAVMPEMDGAKTLKEIRRLHVDIPVIGMSGFSEVEAADHFGDQMQAFLQKPFTRSQLMSTVTDVLGAADRKLPQADAG